MLQGLTDLIQLLLWAGAGVVALVGLWRGKGKELLGERVEAVRSVLATRGGVAGGTVAVGHDVQGDIIMVTDPDLLWRAIRRRSPNKDLRQATERYLAYLVDRYRYLDFKGMGVSDRVPLRLSSICTFPSKPELRCPREKLGLGSSWRGERCSTRNRQLLASG